MGGGANPAGLGARDVLRLEAGLLLHGNDMSTEVNPYEAGLERFVAAEREGLVAGDALRGVKEVGARRTKVTADVEDKEAHAKVSAEVKKLTARFAVPGIDN